MEVLLMIYKTKDVCCQEIHLEVENGIIKNLKFDRGCNGNLQGMSTLCIGRNAEDIIKSLSGITCNNRLTSCPDQLARALKEAIN